MSFWSFYFGWFTGAVYSNLIASGLCAGLVYWRARVHLRRHREAQDKQVAAAEAVHEELHARTHAMVEGLHARLDSLHERLTAEMPPEDET